MIRRGNLVLIYATVFIFSISNSNLTCFYQTSYVLLSYVLRSMHLVPDPNAIQSRSEMLFNAALSSTRACAVWHMQQQGTTRMSLLEVLHAYLIDYLLTWSVLYVTQSSAGRCWVCFCAQQGDTNEASSISGSLKVVHTSEVLVIVLLTTLLEETFAGTNISGDKLPWTQDVKINFHWYKLRDGRSFW